MEGDLYDFDASDAWTEFMSFPSSLFAEEPKLEVLDGLTNVPTSSEAPLNGTVSSTGSTQSHDDAVPFLLPATDFVFQTGPNKSETLAERMTPRFVGDVVTTGTPFLSYDAVMKLIKGEPPEADGTSRIEEEIQQKGKRKQSVVDLEAIEDPEERRRQKRMAKNRRTAAVSRLRKKARLDGLERQIETLQRENQTLKSVLFHLMSQGAQLAAPIDELAMLLTGVLLAIMQSIVMSAVTRPMTLIPVTKKVTSWTRRGGHFTWHSAGLWQRMSVT